MIHLLLVIIYLAFISLGLPDALLGAAWPSMYPVLKVGVSYAGVISMIVAIGTVVSSLMSDRMTVKLGTGKVMVLSVAATAIALFGFSVSSAFWMLCLWAIPYGLGAGSVDAALNNYVALYYESKHMSWLHCMWGVGASLGPYMIGHVLTAGGNWNTGYRLISILQVFLTLLLLFSLPLWKRSSPNAQEEAAVRKPLTPGQILAVPGVKAVMLCFFCYCALEQTAGLWAASYLNLYKGIPAETAASLGSMFFLGITIGRALSGFLAMKLQDAQMVRLGFAILAAGIAAMLIPGNAWISIAGLMLIGLGCAPVYPSLIHATPDRFGSDKSQAIIGIQVASAYVGTCLMPPFFGLLAGITTVALLPFYLLLILALMSVMFRILTSRTAPAVE